MVHQHVTSLSTIVHQYVTSSVFVQCNGTKMYREARSEKLGVRSWELEVGS
ncbi:hypothetical protein [Flavobacterium luteum]|uniref:hypothetical protein n=1 Tax=Flavobacterium luteum TaxID=2026654 RepID=UPI001786B3D3|nr:hypothetical protein [Flavobacterium luteum]